ncbi:SDR family oxidoreductase [Candidatus Daviesbacteria bacterium]|nr:SDR family oxidoreductase [Candidatus Daviesbacteria bacterium]
MERFRLDGKIAVVTGALGLLGPTFCEGLLEAGATVIGIDLTTQVPERFRVLQERFGDDKAGVVRADITYKSEVDEALAACIRRFGVPAILVNAAGIDKPPLASARSYPLEEIPLEVNRRFLEVNVLGTFRMMQVFGGAMRKHEIRGSIINIGSQYADVVPDPHFYDHLKGFLKLPIYGASKAALIELTREFAVHFGRYGIRVNALSPGGIYNEQKPQDPEFLRKFSERVPLVRMEYPHRMGFAHELIGPLLFLASEASSYMTGENLRVNGGFTAL